MKILKQLKEIENKYNVTIVYCTMSGSKLYGTDGPDSDTDYKFLFIPNYSDVILKKDEPHIKIGKDTKEKNTKEDIDFDGSSIYKFFNELKVSETGAVDVLFSMFRDDTIIFQDEDFTEIMKNNYQRFMNSNMRSFIGYALGQSKKFGIKGARYGELDDFVKKLYVWTDKYLNHKVDDGKGSWNQLKNWVEGQNYKYIKFIMAPGPRDSGGYKEIEYISILGKMFSGTVTNEYLYDRVFKLYDQFGNRTKTIAKTLSKTDYKAISHALRVALEVRELLETNFIKFPLKDAQYLKNIKDGNCDVEKVFDEVGDTLADVDLLLETSKLPEESDTKFIELLTQNFVEGLIQDCGCRGFEHKFNCKNHVMGY